MLKTLRKHWAVIVASVLIAAALVGLLVPYLTHRRRVHSETSAVAAMVSILAAQATFHKTDYYGKGILCYASPHVGRGFEDLYEVIRDDGTVKHVGLISRALAEAVDPEHAHNGYYYMDLLRNGPVQTGPGPKGWTRAVGAPSPQKDYDPSIEFGICAIPYPYTPGQKTFIMTTGGTVYAKYDPSRADTGFAVDTKGKPPAECFPRE